MYSLHMYLRKLNDGESYPEGIKIEVDPLEGQYVVGHDLMETPTRLKGFVRLVTLKGRIPFRFGRKAGLYQSQDKRVKGVLENKDSSNVLLTGESVEAVFDFYDKIRAGKVETLAQWDKH